MSVFEQVEVDDVDTFESLEGHTEELILEVDAHGVAFMQLGEKFTAVHIGVHEGGQFAMSCFVARPSGLHLV